MADERAVLDEVPVERLAEGCETSPLVAEVVGKRAKESGPLSQDLPLFGRRHELRVGELLHGEEEEEVKIRKNAWSTALEPPLAKPRRIAVDGPADGADEVTAHVVAAAMQDVAAVSTPASDRLRDPDGLTTHDDEGIDVPGHAGFRDAAEDGVDH